MTPFERSHVADETLLRTALARRATISESTAHLIADIGEIDARKLYLPAGYRSIRAYCVEALEMPDDSARRHIHAAHTARRFPVIFAALADRRLCLTAVITLAPCLTPANAEGLVAAARHKSKTEVEWLLAERLPRPDALGWVAGCAPERISEETTEGESGSPTEPVVVAPGAAHVATRPTVKPLSAESCEAHFTMKRSAQEKLQYVQELLGHESVELVFERSLDAFIVQLEKRMFAATSKPRSGSRRSANPRHIPAHVKRLVVKRDGRQCTFVSDTGHRCSARGKLEFDHVLEVARGGEATVDNIRLRCRAHNQYEAERAFGTEFMRRKRDIAMHRTAEARSRMSGATPLYRERVRRGAEIARAIPDAPLEERVRYVLRRLTSRGVHRPVACGGRE